MADNDEKATWATIGLRAKIKTGIVLGGFTVLILLMGLGQLANSEKAKSQKQKPGTTQRQHYTPPSAKPQSAGAAAAVVGGNVGAGGALVAEKSAGVWASAKNKIADWLDFSEKEKKPAAVLAPATARSAVAARPAAVAPPAASPAVVVPAPAVAAPAAAAPVAAPAPAAAPVARPVAAARPKSLPAEATPELDRLIHGLDGILKN